MVFLNPNGFPDDSPVYPWTDTKTWLFHLLKLPAVPECSAMAGLWSLFFIALMCLEICVAMSLLVYNPLYLKTGLRRFFIIQTILLQVILVQKLQSL